MRPIIALRPEPGLSATLEAGRKLGLNMHGFPLSRIVPVGWSRPATAAFDALLIGSANVFRHGGEGLESIRHLPVSCVGEITARAARDAGFVVAHIGTGGLQNVLDANARQECRYLRLGGEERIALSPHPGQSIRDITVYRARYNDMPVKAVELLRGQPIVILHSAATARYFAQQTVEHAVLRDKIDLAVLGPRIARAAGSGWRSVRTACRPDDAALLELIAAMCKADREG